MHSNLDLYLLSKIFLKFVKGCQGQGTSETSYLCKPCFAEQQAMRQDSTISNKNHINPPTSQNDNVPFPGRHS